MTNAELLATIRAEIERRLKNTRDYMNGAGMKYKGPKYHASRGRESAYDAILSFLYTLESEKPMNPADAMKELDEKIALVKQRGTWDGVDVDKFMDDVRGREPKNEGLEEEIKRYGKEEMPVVLESDLNDIARHFAQWGAEHSKK